MILLAAALAQNPAANWKVAETEHFVVHYPEAAESWALNAARRMESTREAVAEEVGWTPRFRTQVIVEDPYSEANGMALPVGNSPRMVLWTTPPSADSVIGHYRDPADLLVTHEDAHVVHMMKPPRGLSGQLFLQLFRAGPIAVKSPRWVIEGYATVVEGRVTGSGRPHADYRGALMRRLAQQGALPSYGELSGSRRWQGYSFAYLVGSAFLEWVDARAGGDSLPKLWTRMTAKKVRTFDQAFTGLYGDSPLVLYKRFCAEVTADAMAADGAEWNRSGLWMDTKHSTGRPAVSPDGARLAMVVRSSKGPARLKVVETQVDAKAVDRREKLIASILERDPEDAPPAPLAAPPHKTVRTLVDRTHSPRNPRWSDANHLVYDAPVFDSNGRMRRDLFRWNVETNRVQRLTHGEDLRRVDVRGQKAVAVRSVFGKTQLVWVDLDSGSTQPLTPLSASEIVDQPRLSPDGEAVVFLRNASAEGFRPVVRGADGAERALPVPEGSTVMQVAWGEEGILATLGVAGRVDVWSLGDEPLRLTQSGAALGPEPTSEGLFHLEMQADGFELHKRESGNPSASPEGSVGLVGRAAATTPTQHALQPVVGRPMGLGRLEPRILAGGMVGTRASNFEVGARLGDVVGRNEFVVNGSLGDSGGVTGGTLWWVNRTLPADLHVRTWLAADGLSPAWLGGHLGFSAETGSTVTSLKASTGAFVEQQLGAEARGAGFGAVRGAWIEPRSRALWVRAALRAQAGRAEGTLTSLGEASVGFSLGRTWSLSSDYTLGRATGRPFSLGGVLTGIRSGPAQWNQLQIGWIAPGSAVGTVHDAMEWAFENQGAGVFVQRRRVWGALGVSAHSFVGLRLQQGVPRQPLVRIPGVEIEMGVGCAFEQGTAVDKPCRKIEHYRGWSGLIWRP